MVILYHGNDTIVSYPDYRILYIPCKPNTTYTAQKLAGQRFRIGFTDELPQAGVTISNAKPTSTNGTNDTQVTSTSGANSKYLCLWYWYKTEDKQDMLNSIQIEVGSTATTYEPYTSTTHTLHLGTLELAGIGNYIDCFETDRSTGKWYKYDYLTKVKLLSTNNWSGQVFNNVYRVNTNSFTSLIKALPERDNSLISTHFVANWGNVFGTLKNNYIGIYSNANIYVSTQFNSTNLSGWKDFLDENDVYVYCPLATPTSTEITDTTLIQELEELYNMYSYSGTTNISISGNLPFIMKVRALKGN